MAPLPLVAKFSRFSGDPSKMKPTGVLATLVHRTAHGRHEGSWEFSVVHGIHHPRPTVFARIVLGGRTYDVDIPVCDSRNPLPESYPIIQLYEGAWRVSAARYGRSMSDIAVPVPFVDTDDFPTGSLDLVLAPPDVEADLRRVAAGDF